MEDLRLELVGLLNGFFPRDGIHDSAMSSVQCIRVSHPNHSRRLYWPAALCIVVQGCKEVVLGGRTYRFDAVHYVATPIDLPVVGGVAAATPEKPFLCLRIAMDPRVVSELDAELDLPATGGTDGSQRGVFVGNASDRMLEAAIRLSELLRSPEDLPVLGPLAIKELFYHVLKEPQGPAIRRFIHAGSATHRVYQAIHTILSHLNNDIDVVALAESANMSRSTFFSHFKAVTSMSPIQYQKRLRLLEAQRLMVEAGETAERAAFEVGYRSASQFSREYSRMFGEAPFRDALQIRNTERERVSAG